VVASAVIDSASGQHREAAASPAALPNSRKFLIFAVLAFGQFMALLDIQIVAASLNEVQAGLSAAPDEISWVQTAYLMAELVMIPLSAFLSQAMSTRWLFAASAGLFTLASIACGLAWDIESMIAFRAIQGFVGGAMVPTVFAVGFTLFEGKQRAMIPAILGVVSVLAPTIGPTVDHHPRRRLALDLLHQYRARRRGYGPRYCPDPHRPRRHVDVRAYRLGAACRHGDRPRGPAICP